MKLLAYLTTRGSDDLLRHPIGWLAKRLTVYVVVAATAGALALGIGATYAVVTKSFFQPIQPSSPLFNPPQDLPRPSTPASDPAPASSSIPIASVSSVPAADQSTSASGPDVDIKTYRAALAEVAAIREKYDSAKHHAEELDAAVAHFQALAAEGQSSASANIVHQESIMKELKVRQEFMMKELKLAQRERIVEEREREAGIAGAQFAYGDSDSAQKAFILMPGVQTIAPNISSKKLIGIMAYPNGGIAPFGVVTDLILNSRMANGAATLTIRSLSGQNFEVPLSAIRLEASGASGIKAVVQDLESVKPSSEASKPKAVVCDRRSCRQ